MTIISGISSSSGDAFARLIEGLRLEFGCTDVAALAERIFAAEKLDFLWDARVSERYLGQHFEIDCSDDGDVARLAILSFFGGRWHAGVCLVDGEGSAIGSLWLRSFDRRKEAAEAFECAR